LNGDGDNRVTGGVSLDPFGDLGKMLVLLADVVLLAQVDEGYDGLSGEEEKRVDVLDLANCKQMFATSISSIYNAVGMLLIREGLHFRTAQR
jgi:hypothetical protein